MRLSNFTIVFIIIDLQIVYCVSGEGRKKLGMTKLIEANKFGKIKHKIKKLK
jgi:hypothetical protein